MLLEGLAGDLAPEQADYVRTIMARGEELLALITQVLEMSQLEMGAVRLDLRGERLEEIVKRAVDTVQLSADQSGIRIEVQPFTVPRVLADAEKAQRVLINLLGNAIKFSHPDTTVRIDVRLAPISRPFREETLFGEEADDAVRITVADQGIGIPEEQLGRVFEAFYQADASSTREHGGAGLGLSIVKNLVGAHGGDVWAESKVGAGTSVHFTLPLASEAALQNE
jgi:signal transduction histidine kinase